jgi:hypothetical protein
MVPNTYDLKATLPAVSTFLDAQKSGPLPASAVAAYPWVENPSDLQRSEPIRGGYYMSDDYVKYSFPMATTTAMLAWTVLQFGAGYAAAGQLGAVQAHVRWGADYLMKAHTAASNFVVQVRGLGCASVWGGGYTTVCVCGGGGGGRLTNTMMVHY